MDKNPIFHQHTVTDAEWWAEFNGCAHLHGEDGHFTVRTSSASLSLLLSSILSVLLSNETRTVRITVKNLFAFCFSHVPRATLLCFTLRLDENGRRAFLPREAGASAAMEGPRDEPREEQGVEGAQAKQGPRRLLPLPRWPLEHPHFMEVALSSSDDLYLRGAPKP